MHDHCSDPDRAGRHELRYADHAGPHTATSPYEVPEMIGRITGMIMPCPSYAEAPRHARSAAA